MYAVSLLSLLLGWLTAATVAAYALTLRRQLRQHRRDPLTGVDDQPAARAGFAHQPGEPGGQRGIVAGLLELLAGPHHLCAVPGAGRCRSW